MINVARYASLLYIARAWAPPAALRRAPHRARTPAAASTADELLEEARRLREEADQLSGELTPRVRADDQKRRAPDPRTAPALPDSTWRFACNLEGRESFAFEATLLREERAGFAEDDKARGRESGLLALVSGDAITQTYGWLAEDDGAKGEFARVTVRVRDGLLESTDGDTVYLQARVRRGEDGVALKEGTLTVRRPRPGTRFLLFEFPSLLADLKIVGRFTATPVAPSSKD